MGGLILACPQSPKVLGVVSSQQVSTWWINRAKFNRVGISTATKLTTVQYRLIRLPWQLTDKGRDILGIHNRTTYISNRAISYRAGMLGAENQSNSGRCNLSDRVILYGSCQERKTREIDKLGYFFFFSSRSLLVFRTWPTTEREKTKEKEELKANKSCRRNSNQVLS